MTQNKGCNATFDKDNKLQTQQCMNIIITRNIYDSPGQMFQHMHFNVPLLVLVYGLKNVQNRPKN